jgi:hypothetical protein
MPFPAGRRQTRQACGAIYNNNRAQMACRSDGLGVLHERILLLTNAKASLIL